MKNVLRFIFFAAGALLFLASCSSRVYAPLSVTPGAMYKEGVLGGTVVKAYQLTGTVASIDASTRTLSVHAKSGSEATVKCDPNVSNFDHLRAGDMVTAIVKDELTISMADANTPPNSPAKMAEPASQGSSSAKLVAATQHYRAIIQSINLKRRQVTLRFPDDRTRTFEVRKDVDLAQRKVGEQVAFRVIVGAAIAVVKL